MKELGLHNFTKITVFTIVKTLLHGVYYTTSEKGWGGTDSRKGEGAMMVEKKDSTMYVVFQFLF